MRGREGIGAGVAIIVALALAGCATSSVPLKWGERADGVQRGAGGAWAQVRLVTPKGGTLGGELIAVSEDTLCLADSLFRAIARENVKSVRVVWYDANPVGMTGAVFFGTILTASNGFWLVFTAPLWMIGGSIAASAASHDAIVDYPAREWKHMAQYARFPQGLPLVIDRGRIRMTPYRDLSKVREGI